MQDGVVVSRLATIGTASSLRSTGSRLMACRARLANFRHGMHYTGSRLLKLERRPQTFPVRCERTLDHLGDRGHCWCSRWSRVRSSAGARPRSSCRSRCPPPSSPASPRSRHAANTLRLLQTTPRDGRNPDRCRFNGRLTRPARVGNLARPEALAAWCRLSGAQHGIRRRRPRFPQDDAIASFGASPLRAIGRKTSVERKEQACRRAADFA